MCRLTVFCLPQADQNGRSLSQIDLALGVPLLTTMSPASMPQATPTPSPIPAALQAFRRPFLQAHSDSGSNSNRAPSFKAYLFSRPAPQQLDQVDEDHSFPSSAVGENADVLARGTAESLANPRQRAGEEPLSSSRSPHTRVDRDRQELSAAGPSSTGNTLGQEQREGRARPEAIAPGEPYGESEKVLGSSQAASKTSSRSNVSSRLGWIPDEVLHASGTLLRIFGGDQPPPAQRESGSSPLLRASTAVSSEVGHLAFAGVRPIRGKNHGRVPVVNDAAAAQRSDLRQTGSPESSDGESSDGKSPKADGPNQSSPQAVRTRSNGAGRTLSFELPSGSLPTGRTRLVDRTSGVEPVRVPETPEPQRGTALPRLSPRSPQPASDLPGSQMFPRPSGRPHNAALRITVEDLEFFGERLSGGKSHGRVRPASDGAAAARGSDLRQTASAEASVGGSSDSTLTRVDRPNQPSPRPVQVLPQPAIHPRRSQGSLQPSGHPHKEPLREAGGPEIRLTEKTVSENAEPVASHSPVPREPAQESSAFQSRESSAPDRQPQPSDQQAGNSSFREVGPNPVLVTQVVPDVSPLTGAPPNDSSLRAALGVTQPAAPEYVFVPPAHTHAFSVPAVPALAELTPPEPVSTALESNGQPPRRQEVRESVPPSTNSRQADLPRLPHWAAELSLESHPDGSNTDRLTGQGSKLESSSGSFKLPIREAPAKVPQDPSKEKHVEFRRVAQVAGSSSGDRSVTGRASHHPTPRVVSTQVAAATRWRPNDSRAASVPIPPVPSAQQGNLDRGAVEAGRSDIGEPGTRSPHETASARVMAKTSASDNAADLRTLSRPARSTDRIPPPAVKTTAPVARSEAVAVSHTPAESKASVVLPSQSSARNVDAGSLQTEPHQEASSAASRVRSVERLVDMAALHRKIDSHQMNLLLSDDRIGRMSVRLVERGGVIDTLVRTDSTRASHLFTEGLPGLLESLAQRGLQAANPGAGHFLGAREDAQPQQGGRYRPPRHPQRQNRRGGSDAGRVFRLEFE